MGTVLGRGPKLSSADLGLSAPDAICVSVHIREVDPETAAISDSVRILLSSLPAGAALASPASPAQGFLGAGIALILCGNQAHGTGRLIPQAR